MDGLWLISSIKSSEGSRCPYPSDSEIRSHVTGVDILHLNGACRRVDTSLTGQLGPLGRTTVWGTQWGQLDSP